MDSKRARGWLVSPMGGSSVCSSTRYGSLCDWIHRQNCMLNGIPNSSTRRRHLYYSLLKIYIVYYIIYYRYEVLVSYIVCA
uniref:Uncharacterized protein n=1 Tax=Pyxicephalus adspersus TaxID=30357 RepID=A0AAV3A211_PYXAD|nr:TPA: hypothetical protein GDO54_003083 [Pyxicephalus adspersus]